MANIIDYVQSRGGAPLSAAPFNEVDALVLSTLVYLPLGGMAQDSAPLGEAARALLASGAGTGFPKGDVSDARLLEAVANGKRYADVRVTGFVERFDRQTQEQFAAATFLCGDEAVVAFRGTDATIVGWKEDFDMSFELEVPAQRSAVAYAQRARETLGRPLRLCGHSKGGNLAAYAALFSDAQTKDAVLTAYSFDGPGFNEAVAARRAQTEAARLRTYVPQGSIVGMLLWHSEPFTVVRSDGLGIFQHDPYTWQVMGGAFVPAERTLHSRYADATLKDWLGSLPAATRKRAIDGIYEVLSATGDRNLSDLLDAGSLLTALRAARSLDADTRAAIEEMLRLLGSAAATAAPDTLREAAERFEEDATQRFAEAAGRFGEGAAQELAGRVEEGRQRVAAAREEWAKGRGETVKSWEENARTARKARGKNA